MTKFVIAFLTKIGQIHLILAGLTLIIGLLMRADVWYLILPAAIFIAVPGILMIVAGEMMKAVLEIRDSNLQMLELMEDERKKRAEALRIQEVKKRQALATQTGNQSPRA